MRTRPSRLGSAALATTLGAAMLGLAAAPALAAPAPSLSEVGAGCQITDATLTWGVKESFRSYITGIAKGQWTQSGGAEYATPSFSWPNGAGELTGEGAGTIGFAGSVHFEGHEGLLKIDVANPTLRFDGNDEATLLLDLSSTKQTGEPDQNFVQEAAVSLDLRGAFSADGTTLTITDAPGELTAQGAVAFGGFYQAGDEVDPVTITATATGCEVTASAAPETPAPETGDPAVDAPAAEAPAVPWLPIGIGAVALAVIAGVAIALVRGGKKDRAAASEAAAEPGADPSDEAGSGAN